MAPDEKERDAGPRGFGQYPYDHLPLGGSSLGRLNESSGHKVRVDALESGGGARVDLFPLATPPRRGDANAGTLPLRRPSDADGEACGDDAIKLDHVDERSAAGGRP